MNKIEKILVKLFVNNETIEESVNKCTLDELKMVKEYLLDVDPKKPTWNSLCGRIGNTKQVNSDNCINSGYCSTCKLTPYGRYCGYGVDDFIPLLDEVIKKIEK